MPYGGGWQSGPSQQDARDIVVYCVEAQVRARTQQAVGHMQQGQLSKFEARTLSVGNVRSVKGRSIANMGREMGRSGKLTRVLPATTKSPLGVESRVVPAKHATPQTVVSANSQRWGRFHSAEVLTTLNTRSDPPGLYLKLAPTDV